MIDRTIAKDAASATAPAKAIRIGERRVRGCAADGGTTSLSGRPTASRKEVYKAASRPQSLHVLAC